jgi:nicotinamidase-related amidase
MDNTTALLIIDVQMFGFEETNPVYKSDQLLINIGGLLTQARKAGVPVVYVQHSEPEEMVGKPPWEIHPAIVPGPNDVVVQKCHPDSFQDTGLQSELESRGIKKLVVAGMQTEYCIDTTCRRAYSLGYEVTLVKDGHSTWDTDSLTAAQIIVHHNNVLSSWFVELKTADEVTFA